MGETAYLMLRGLGQQPAAVVAAMIGFDEAVYRGLVSERICRAY